MPLQSSLRVQKKPLRLDDEVRFLRSWIEKPLHVGAVMPSGKVLARVMAQFVNPNASGPIVELGPGTGAITTPLIPKSLSGVSTQASERIWLNIPPARVWVYRKG